MRLIASSRTALRLEHEGRELVQPLRSDVPVALAALLAVKNAYKAAGIDRDGLFVSDDEQAFRLAKQAYKAIR